nr:receptor-transporting protein 3-like isoform X2 [Pogona vitticeps]
MLNWESEFKKKIAEYKPWDKWTLTKDLENSQVPHGWHCYEQRNLFARFKCSSCSHSWKSAQATIVFHVHLDCSSGQVKMRVFGQKCNRCASPKYEEPSFQDDTVVFVLHNLVHKILQNCYRESRVLLPLPPPVSEDLLEGPHKIGSREPYVQRTLTF